MASIQEIVARRAPVASLPQASPNPNVGVGLISDAGSAGFRQLGQVRGISLDTATGFGQAMATDAQTFGMVGEVVGQIATVVDELNEASEKARLVSAGNLADKKIKHWNSIADETEREEYRLKDVEPALAKIRTQRKNLISIADNSRNALIAEMGTLGNAHKLNAAKSRGYMELAKLRSELDAAKGSEKIEIGKRYGALSDTFITTGALDPKEAYLLGRDTQNILKASQNSVVSDELTSFYSNSNLTTRALGELRAKLADGKTTVPKDHPLYSIEKYATDNLGVTELLKIADAAYANRVKGKKDFNDSVAIEDQASFNELVSSGVVRDITKKVNSISSGVINVGGLMTATEELNKMKASYLKANGYSAKLEAEIDSQIRSAQAYMTKIVELGGRQMRPEINSWLMARSKKDQSTYAEKFMLARGDIDEAKKVVSELRQEPGFNKTVLSKLSNDDLAATLSGNPELIDKALTSSKLPLAYKVETLKKAIKAQHDLEVAGKSPYQKKSPDKAEAKFLSDIDNVMNDDNLSNKGKEEKINKIDEQFQDYIKPVAGNIKKSVDVQIETEGAVFELSNLTGNLIRSDNFAGLVYEKGKSKEDKVRDEKIVEDALRKTTEHYMGEGYTAQQASAIALNLFENAKNEIKDVLEVPDFTKIPNVPDNSLKPEDVRDAFGGENTDTGLPSASKGLSDSIERVANAVPETLGVQRLDKIVVTPESFEDKVAAAKAMEFGGENTKWNKDTQSWDLVEEDKAQAPMPNDDGIVLTDQERSRGNFSQGAQGGGEQFDPQQDLEELIGRKLKMVGDTINKEQIGQIGTRGFRELVKNGNIKNVSGTIKGKEVVFDVTTTKEDGTPKDLSYYNNPINISTTKKNKTRLDDNWENLDIIYDESGKGRIEAFVDANGQLVPKFKTFEAGAKAGLISLFGLVGENKPYTDHAKTKEYVRAINQNNGEIRIDKLFSAHLGTKEGGARKAYPYMQKGGGFKSVTTDKDNLITINLKALAGEKEKPAQELAFKKVADFIASVHQMENSPWAKGKPNYVADSSKRRKTKLYQEILKGVKSQMEARAKVILARVKEINKAKAKAIEDGANSKKKG